MNPLIVLATAMAIGMLIIPLMWQLAPRLGLMDEPDPRKVHLVPVARVGGWGIILGALVPLLLWVELDPLMASFLIGSLVLFFFGALDDHHDIGHWGKFVGQFLAVGVVVYYGDLYVQRLPFMGVESLDPMLGQPFTVFAMVGMINAINHSDGLDGLAGGEAMLSLMTIAVMSYLSEGGACLLIAMAAIGGTLGFLRFNTHPARVFMGDCGSQFLGFTLGFLAVLLTQHVNPALSAAVPALILGLPIVDILAVLAQRIYHKMNWFKASRNHIHHRLLDLGFDHYETVVIIYSVQAVLVVSAILLRYESDALIVGLYVAICGGMLVLITVLEKRGWTAHAGGRDYRVTAMIRAVKSHPWFLKVPRFVVAVGVPLFLVATGFAVAVVPRDFGVISAVLFTVLVAESLFGKSVVTIALRSSVYATVLFVVYLALEYQSPLIFVLEQLQPFAFAAIAAAIWICVRYSAKSTFKTTPTDYLIVFGVLVVGVFASGFFPDHKVGSLLVRTIILLYGCELILNEIRSRWSPLGLAVLGVLGSFAVRGLL